MPCLLHIVACEIAASILCFQVPWKNLKPSFSSFCRPLILLFLFLQCTRLYGSTSWCSLCRMLDDSTVQLTVWQDSSLRVFLEDPHNRDRWTVLQHHPDAVFPSCSGFTAHPLHAMSLHPFVLQERRDLFLLGPDCMNCPWQPYRIFCDCPWVFLRKKPVWIRPRGQVAQSRAVLSARKN